MCLGKYGIKIKKYLKEYYPIKYNELIINCTLMDYLYTNDKNCINKVRATFELLFYISEVIGEVISEIDNTIFSIHSF